ncbi:MAM domain-containing glycosylphosphatidylinositol anchor protein 1-like protein [Dinothrombium tinctorium]|uniref:MAM domain-containing glycosylphosphatidylinositol anchor protein 1-like protein n=1 Tax=Dinothrombium tinctorium TaxID=1965070 RepID=A0A443RJD0_9ACAR|nr:MAM domain-containing glycosylphosphatidylinositol anchor protein 1-like protein [Dinothrombium tinctorium]
MSSTFGKFVGFFKVFVKPESRVFAGIKPLWVRSGLKADQWLQAKLPLPMFYERIQIVIEVVPKDADNIALDDFALIANSNCSKTNYSDSEPMGTGCRDRCNSSDAFSSNSSSQCSCSQSCKDAGDCCDDYIEYCDANNATTLASDVSTDASSEQTATASLSTNDLLTTLHYVSSEANTVNASGGEADEQHQNASIHSLVRTSVQSYDQTTVLALNTTEKPNNEESSHRFSTVSYSKHGFSEQNTFAEVTSQTVESVESWSNTSLVTKLIDTEGHTAPSATSFDHHINDLFDKSGGIKK